MLLSVPELSPMLQIDQDYANCLLTLQKGIYSQRIQAVHPNHLFTLHNMVRWATNEQQDVHEFLIFLLENLHEEHLQAHPNYLLPIHIEPNSWEAHIAQNPSIVTELTNGQFSLTFSCLVCQNSFLVNEHFSYCPVHLNSTDIIIEPPPYLDQRPCRFCDARQTMCTTNMTRCPPVLFVLLMRFEHLQKNNKRMRILRRITMKNRVVYKLSAVINHSGTTQRNGHYVSLLCKNNKWFKCDDDRVQQYSLPTSSSAAYLLMFVQQM